MSQKLLKAVSPDNIDISGRLYNTFGKWEKETVARNIVLIANKLGGWKAFSWEEYRKNCDHNVSEGEKSVLDTFVEEEILSFDKGKYHLTDRFIGKLAGFIK
jgi:hypothetical protein